MSSGDETTEAKLAAVSRHGLHGGSSGASSAMGSVASAVGSPTPPKGRPALYPVPRAQKSIGRFLVEDFGVSAGEFKRDLEFALQHRFTRPKLRGVAGQNPSCRGDGLGELRRCLRDELNAWYEHAQSVQVANALAFHRALTEAVADTVLASVPGPSELALDLAVVINEAIAVAASLRTGSQAVGSAVSIIGGIVINHVSACLAEEDMARRRALFIEAMFSSLEIVESQIAADLYNLETLYEFRLQWLVGAEHAELGDFTIPFTPPTVSHEAWKAELTRQIEARMNPP